MTGSLFPDKPPGGSEIVIYQTEDGKSRIQVRLEGGSVWLTQRLIADLFDVTVPTVNEHLRNVFEESELDPAGTIRKFLIVQQEGEREVRRDVDHYNLDAILAVGYRVRSSRGTQFRRWATERLREYIVKGFVMDDERLKEGRSIGADYFDELLERIRDIRASEKRFYQKIRDLYALAVDYDPASEESQEFFRIVQNKLHWAVTGKTAAELIQERADASRPNMGLTNWRGAKVRLVDVTVAKNYLTVSEIESLNRVVVMYLDYAEDQARLRRPLYMRDWRQKLDAFLRFNEREVLDDPGKVSMEVAQELALKEYEAFSQRRLAEEAEASNRELDDLAKRLEADAKSRESLPSPGAKGRRSRRSKKPKEKP